MANILTRVWMVIFMLQGAYNEDNFPTQQRTEQHPAVDFNHHTLVKPKIYHGREKRQVSTTEEKGGAHANYVQITMEVDGQEMILDLTLNKQLIPKGFFQKHQEKGKYKVRRPSIEEVDICHYNGKVRGKQNSWVALSTCDGLSGVIFDGIEMRYIERNSKNLGLSVEDAHFLYKHSDLKEHNKTCGYSGDASDPRYKHAATDNKFLRYKRATENSELIRGPYNANKESKYVELILVVDNREFKELGENKRKVLNHCKNIANIINALYSPLNIFIALVGVVIWSEHDEITFSTNGDTTLTNFLHYRREKLVPEHPNDNAQLLSKFNFDHGVVGKALKGPICTYEYSGGVNTDHSHVVGLVATTIAHEMGHNFGMEHDTTECKCPDERCIMAPSSSTIAPTHWSSCSLNYLLLAFTHGMDYCLKNKPEFLFDSPVCGNGFVEPGEQCDCGLPEHCDNTCCNATTCMLHSNASCATGECCDLTTCRPKNAGTLCRSADYECDLPEYCTGQSEYCPADIYKMDTEVCDDGRAFCYRGFCRTRTDQCKLLWGETGKSSDDLCYEMNMKGDRYGNCGYNKFNQSYFKCDQESALCGMLHCKHLNERLEFGMESVSILSHRFINKKGSIIPCRTAIVDLGTNQIDPGLTPDGAKCGEGKMCVNQKCMPVLSLRKQTLSCEKDCNGNGWCNNKGHCHCKEGFAPPFCEYPGLGGSEDSGPTADPNARQGVVKAMFILFLGVIPTLALLAFLSYYAKYNLKLGRKLSQPATSKSPSKSRGSSFPSETAKRTEDNHSLLHGDNAPASGFNNDFFGNFKGFSLTSAKNKPSEPARSAPLPPIVTTSSWSSIKSTTNYTKPCPPIPTATVKSPKLSLFDKPVQKINLIRNSSLLHSNQSSESASSNLPTLPPPNPGSTARPIISSPVLESSTSNAKELLSPLKNAAKVPVRPAPDAPKTENSRPLSSPDGMSHTVLHVDVKPDSSRKMPKDKEHTSAGPLTRITSFLRSVDKKPLMHSNSLPKAHQVKASKILDKETLRNLQISDPVPQTKIDIPATSLPVDAAAKKAVIMRAQSMRVTTPTQRPNIQTFGSMRQAAGFKRPLSIPSGVRPKSPPPPRPPLQISEMNVSKGDDEFSSNQYDDCLNEAVSLSKESSPTSSDNIYAVIEESPVPAQSVVVKNTSQLNDSGLGLLGEIVSEIQNRNFDSIYSTSTLNRKKKEAEEKKGCLLSPDSSDTYVNTSSIYKVSESEYSNMSNLKSSGSSTSSGYIHPSAVNVPLQQSTGSNAEEKPSKPILGTFKSDSTKSFSSTFKRPPGPLAAIHNVKKVSDTNSDNTFDKSKVVDSKKSKTSATSKNTSTTSNKTAPKNAVNRQVTPPNLRTRKPSPSRPPSQISLKSNRSVTNSPDLVTSCNTNSGSKEPDVLNGGSTTKKPSLPASKPVVNTQTKPNLKNCNLRSVSFKSHQDKKVEAKLPTATKLNKANSDAGKTTSVGVKNAAKQNSNVASLQQKFEEKNVKQTPKINV
ncbi:disintegrin and metalloproteinase domain-containing protein 12 [Cylas formicarius]|uniref:disintegrin and metalloproteinase domain-containing protein 12 n=1 Tax=Cylas formicarius TaxID=197179 RepID=UPI002958CEC6|nr:disintegrin and metalloproteinase domain-containing protein 12 [Cylas formicarius]